MSSSSLRILGFLFLIFAAVVAVLNLKRVANLGVIWLAPVLLVIGIALVMNSRKRAS